MANQGDSFTIRGTIKMIGTLGPLPDYAEQPESSPSDEAAREQRVAEICRGDKACGREIPMGEEYRCLDCDAVMHKDCLRWHCANDEKDRQIFSLQGVVQQLRSGMERLCVDADKEAESLRAELRASRSLLSEAGGVSSIAAERSRQIHNHGFDASRDDEYTHHELVSAAVHYALNDGWDRRFWPSTWDVRWDQKANDDRITQLAKSGALIAAEIDRLQRAAARALASREDHA